MTVRSAENEPPTTEAGISTRTIPEASRIWVGIVLFSSSSSSSSSAGRVVSEQMRRMLPDRILPVFLYCDNKEDDDDDAWSMFDCPILVLCMTSSSGNNTATNTDKLVDYVKRNKPLVLTDLDLERNVSDRRTFYNVLIAAGLGSTVLPQRRAMVSRDGYNNNDDDDNVHNDDDDDDDDSTGSNDGDNRNKNKKKNKILDRRDYVVINGNLLMKPILERPADPSNLQVRVYYPRSRGGGCKVVTHILDNDDDAPDDDKETIRCTVSFQSELKYLPKKAETSFIYEELMTPEESSQRRRLLLMRGQSNGEINVATGTKQMVGAMAKKVMGKKSTIINDYDDDDDNIVSWDSDLSRLDRKIYVVTTASLPWMTGTAVNPLLRAAYLMQQQQQQGGNHHKHVTLVVPWLTDAADREKVYGTQHTFQTSDEQEVYVREWLKTSGGMVNEADPTTGIQIIWYPSKYMSALGSIFPTDDICSLIPEADADYCILEEPEHLNWFRTRSSSIGQIWTEKFTHVVGIIHTNYRAYAMEANPAAGPIISGLSTWMVRAYCDKVIKLSATLQEYAPEKEVVCNVHGVRADFLQKKVTMTGASSASDDESSMTRCYFIGKLLWEKGLDRLLRLQYFYKQSTGSFFPIDIVGDGPDRTDIEEAYSGDSPASTKKILGGWWKTAVMPFPTQQQKGDVVARIPGTFHGRQDHADFCGNGNYKAIVNPSITEVLCTTTAEALAMGKFAIIPKHPSNEFFYQFPNCLSFGDPSEFVEHITHALTHDPIPLTDELAYIFTWEAATERLMSHASLTMKEFRTIARANTKTQDERIAKYYNKLGPKLNNNDPASIGKHNTNKLRLLKNPFSKE